MLEAALSQGIWAGVAIFLLIYIVRANEKRDQKQEQREKNYQEVIEKLTESFQSLNEIQEDLKEVKNCIFSTKEKE